MDHSSQRIFSEKNMCRLMIRRVSTGHVNPSKDLMNYKRGDVVLVIEDTESFGLAIESYRSGRHVIVEMPFVPASTFAHLMDMDEDKVTGGDVDDTIVRRRRAKQFDFGLLTAGEKAALDHTRGKHVMSQARMNAMIKDKPAR